MLKETFIQLISANTNDSRLVNQLWQEVEENYTHKKRHYHNLQHLDNLLQQILEIKNDLKNRNATLFALYYHDIVYNALKRNNEEKSAEFAQNRMQLIGVPQPTIDLCVQQILATRKHELSDNSDVNYFTDADLCILGQPCEVYEAYYKNVRKEYSLFPDLIYMPGRKKVVQYFLQMDRIFKTPFFYNKFEAQAKENLQRELELYQ